MAPSRATRRVPDTTAPGPSGEAKPPGEGRRLVALFTPNFLPYSQTFIYEQLLHYERYEPEVFARRRLNADRFPDPRVCTLLPGGLSRRVENWLYGATARSPIFLRRLRERGHHLIHAQFGRTGLSALRYHTALHIPLVVTFRGHDVALLAGRDKTPHPWLNARRGRLFRSASRILAVSADLARRLVALGAPADRVHIWHVGIRIPTVSPPRDHDGPLQLLMAGRFVEKKGFEDGIDACARLVGSGLDARLCIIGDGERQSSYEGLIARLGLRDRVDLPGVLTHADLLARITQADVVLVPSITARDGDREGVPNVLKEAAARGVPIVATRHGGIPEALDDGVSGMLVGEGEPAALAAAVRTLWTDPPLRARLGTAARERMARDFDVVRQVAELERHYDDVLREARR